MPSSPPVPKWVETRGGHAPVLLLAPHGGRRTASRHPGRDKVNDLHTADFTRDLAARCDATSIVNGERDRNELDLNRIMQVRTRAPWLLDLLADALEEMLARSARATVVIVHGWNVVQSACDVGVGLVERDGRYLPAGDGRRTASDAFLTATVRPLQDLAARGGITVTIGARYPGAHRNNLVQLFTAASHHQEDLPLQRIAALTPRVDALQLELGIPLRWPGPRRETFVAIVADLLTARRSAGDAAPGETTPALVCGGRVTGRRGVQFVQDDLVGLTSIDTSADGGVAGRLLLSPAPDRLALFTGELARRGDGALCIPNLEYRSDDAGRMRVRYEGPLLSFPSLTPFLDLEHGLADGCLIEAALDLRFVPADTPAVTAPRTPIGTLEGWLTLEGTRHSIRTVARAVDASMATPPRYPCARLTCPATALGHLTLVGFAEDQPPPESSLSFTAPRRFRLALDPSHSHAAGGLPVTGTCDVLLAPPDGRLVLTVATGAAEPCILTGTLERLIPVRRPGRAGTVVLTVYALCRLGGNLFGWLELSTEQAGPHDTAASSA
jgi:hypothetical protein